MSKLKIIFSISFAYIFYSTKYLELQSQPLKHEKIGY